MSKNKTNLLTQAGRQHLNISTTLAMSVVMASSSAVYAAVLPQINLPKQHVRYRTNKRPVESRFPH